MKTTIHKLLGLAATFTLLLGLPAQSAVTLIGDDFSSGSVNKTTNRIRTGQIDSGWYGNLAYGSVVESAWTITSGVIQNDSSTASTGYSSNTAAEEPMWNYISNQGATDEYWISLSFDYNVAAGDELYVHLWGYTGAVPANDQISNPEGAHSGAANNGEGGTSMDAFNLLDGATSGFGGTGTSLSGALTGSGTFSTVIDVAGLGIAGVDSAGDFSSFLIQFAKEEDGLAGTTSIDNLLLAASIAPEPSTLGLILMGAGLLYNRRVRRPGANAAYGPPEFS